MREHRVGERQVRVDGVGGRRAGTVEYLVPHLHAVGIVNGLPSDRGGWRGEIHGGCRWTGGWGWRARVLHVQLNIRLCEMPWEVGGAGGIRNSLCLGVGSIFVHIVRKH
ncbi:hypothetical protein D3C72_1913280 [compost metagenome]